MSLDESWVIVGNETEEKERKIKELKEEVINNEGDAYEEWIGQRWRKYSGETISEEGNVQTTESLCWEGELWKKYI